MIAIARATIAGLRRAEAELAKQEEPQSVLWRAKASHYRPFIERVIAQSERRMLKGEKVPAAEKLVSLFEPQPILSSKAAVIPVTATSSTLSQAEAA